MLLLCGVFGCFRVCAEPESWLVWFSVGADGVTADATTLVFSRVGVGKEGGGGLLVLVPSPSLFLLCGADDGA